MSSSQLPCALWHELRRKGSIQTTLELLNEAGGGLSDEQLADSEKEVELVVEDLAKLSSPNTIPSSLYPHSHATQLLQDQINYYYASNCRANDAYTRTEQPQDVFQVKSLNEGKEIAAVQKGTEGI